MGVPRRVKVQYLGKYLELIPVRENLEKSTFYTQTCGEYQCKLESRKNTEVSKKIKKI